MRLYAKSAIKSSVVTHGLRCNLRGKSNDVALAKENVIEVLEHSKDGSLSSLYEHPVFGTVRDMQKITIPRTLTSNTNTTEDILAFVSNSGYLSFVGWNYEQRRLTNISNVRIAAPGFTPKYLGNSIRISPCQRILVVSALEDVFAIFLVLPNAGTPPPGVVVEHILSHLISGSIWSVEFIPSGEDRPEILYFLILGFKDGKSVMWKFEFNLTTRALHLVKEGTGFEAQAIIPIPYIPQYYLAVKDMSVLLSNLDGTVHQTVELAPKNGEIIHKWCWIDKQLLLGTDKGRIFQICAELTNHEPLYAWKEIGSIPPMSAMIPLAHNQIAIPGEMGDGVVVFVRETVAKVGLHPLVELVSQYEIKNWAPLLDFQVADYYGEGQDQIFALSGMGERGALRIIRNGLAVQVLTSTPQDFNISGMWLADKYVVFAFVNNTRVYKISQWTFEDFSIESGLNLDTTTFYSAFVINQFILQVTEECIRLCKPSPAANVVPPPPLIYNLTEGSVVSCASARNDLIVLGLSKPNKLMVLHVGESTISSLFQVEQDVECSYIEMPTKETCSSNFPAVLGSMIFVGTHKPSVEIYVATFSPSTTLNHVKTVTLSHNEIPSSISCNNLGSSLLYLIVGTREGSVLRWELTLSDSDCVLDNLHTRRIGILPVQLIGDANYGVLALSNHPWLVSSNRNYPTISSISFPMVSHATRAVSPVASQRSYLFVSKQSLHYVTLPSSSKLNVTKYDLHETPLRIVYFKSLKYLAIATCAKNRNGVEESFVRLVDPVSGESNFVKLIGFGKVTCLKDLVVNGRTYLLVGNGREPNATLSLFSVDQMGTGFSLQSIWSRSNTMGSFNCIVDRLPYLIVGVRDNVALMKLNEDLSLDKVDVVQTRSLVTCISAGAARMVVGSVNDGLMFYHVTEQSIKFIAGDDRARLTSGCLMIDDEAAIGVDRMGNIHTLLYSAEPAVNPYYHTAIQAECSYSTGESSLRIQPAHSLVYQAETSQHKTPIYLCPTLLGGVVAIATIADPAVYDDLAALANILATHPITSPILGNSHLRHRSELQESKNVIDGDLVIQFLELNLSVQMEICSLAQWKNRPLLPAEVCRLIERIEHTII